MAKEYIERRAESFYLIGSRVPLAHIVYEFKNGETAETIRSHFATLSLEQVYGAITFYLANKEEVERDILERRRLEDEVIKSLPLRPPELDAKLERAREQMRARKS
jgi:Protein of unknown function (DUF433)